MGAKHELDFSPDSVPESWHRAASLAPDGDHGPLHQSSALLRGMPDNRSIDPLLTFLAGTAMSVSAGFLWLVLYRDGTMTAPWPALGLGLLIAAAVRLGGGPAEATTRASVAGLFYLITLLVVTYFASNWSYVDLYGGSPGLVNYEQELIRSRLTNPEWLLAGIGGFALAIKASLLFGHRIS